jgi:hypothetical protein
MSVIPRAEWGARHDNGQPNVVLVLPYSETWFHHSVTAQLPAGASFEDECKAMRAIEQIGEDRFGQGISYTWLIFPSGRIYEGHSVNRRGAHTAGRNDIARAICFAGNYEVADLTNQQVTSAAWLLQHNHAAGWSKNRTANGGHRDLKQTACPGQHAYRHIPGINYLASGQNVITEDPMPFDQAQIAELNARSYSWRDNTNRNEGDFRNWFYGEWASHEATQAAQNTALAQLLAMHTGGTADVEAIKAEIRTAALETGDRTAAAAAEGARDAVTSTVLPALREALTDVLGDDNEAQADAIVERLARRLAE